MHCGIEMETDQTDSTDSTSNLCSTGSTDSANDAGRTASQFVKLVMEHSGTVTETREYPDGRRSEINYPNLDFWVLNYVRCGLATGDELDIRKF